MKKEGNIYDVSRRFLKMCSNKVSTILCNLFNDCIRVGKYPDYFKIAGITPVYKKGASDIIANYRPVAVLPNVSKIFENVIHDRINSFFNSCCLLSENQYGYRKQKNTELAIFTLIERVLPAFENKCYAVCVFLDFSACFDTISRSLLLDKLNRYGVRGMTLDFLSSYFEDRKQYVNYSGKKSSTVHQKLGVIQGSKCGPLFYDIYTCDISNVCQNEEYIMYADDTVLMYVGENLQSLVSTVNSKLEKVVDWCRFNKLSLNPKKCNFMVLTNKNVNFDPVILLENEPLERVVDTKYLGIYLDENLKYHKQVNVIGNKLSRLSGISYRLKEHLNLSAAKNFYYSCVYSAVTYCICIWGGILQCTQRGTCVINLHEKCVKNIFGKFVPDNLCPFKFVKILKLKDIHRFCASIHMYKIINLNSCPSLQNNITLREPEHNHFTRNRNNLVTPFPRVDNVKINYKYQCISIWNALPNHVKSEASLSKFKKSLSKYFLEMY